MSCILYSFKFKRVPVILYAHIWFVTVQYKHFVGSNAESYPSFIQVSGVEIEISMMTSCKEWFLYCLSLVRGIHKYQWILPKYYNDVIMGAMASHITSLTIVCSTRYSGTDQNKYQSPASLAFVWGIHRWLVNSPHKGPITQKYFPFDNAIMKCQYCSTLICVCVCVCWSQVTCD